MRAIPRARFTGGVLLSAVAFGLAATALGTAGSANATCASLSGHKHRPAAARAPRQRLDRAGAQGCQADSDGSGSVAVAVGNPGYNRFYEGTAHPTLALHRDRQCLRCAR